jgi:hypothetical protein
MGAFHIGTLLTSHLKRRTHFSFPFIPPSTVLLHTLYMRYTGARLKCGKYDFLLQIMPLK